MTEHAIARLAERFPGLDPVQALERIRAARPSDALYLFPALTGETIFRICVPPYVLYPVVSDDGGVLTVLAPGMEAETSTGRHVLPAGVEPGAAHIPAAAYHEDPAPVPSLSSGIARTLLAQSPLHAWTAHPRLNPNFEPKKSKAFDIGTAAHRVVLGAGNDFEVIPDDLLSSNGSISTKDAKAFRDDVESRGLVCLKSGEAQKVYDMADRVRERLAVMGIEFDWRQSEVAAVAHSGGIWSRCMVDNVSSAGPIYDLKTTLDASYNAVQRAVVNYGYDVQAAHYVETWKAATGEYRPFRFVFVEKEPPHEIAVVELTGSALDFAGMQVERARAMWKACTESGEWPGYAHTVHRMDVPEWHHARILETESRGPDWIARAADPSSQAMETARRMQAPDNGVTQ